jgi:predicted kinase
VTTAARAYVIAGAPASGKSALGAELSRHLGAALLDQDTLTGPLTAVVAALVGAAPGDLDDPQVRLVTRGPTYDALLDTAAGCLLAGVPTVLVAPFTTERADPAAWAALRRRLAAPGGVVLVWTTCPPTELVRRLAHRGATRDRRKLADLDRFLASAALRPPLVAHLVVDTTRPLADQVTAVLRHRAGGSPTGILDNDVTRPR